MAPICGSSWGLRVCFCTSRLGRQLARWMSRGLSEVKCGLNHSKKKKRVPWLPVFVVGAVCLCLSVHVLLFSLCQHVCAVSTNVWVCVQTGFCLLLGCHLRHFLYLWNNIFMCTKHGGEQRQQQHLVWWQNTVNITEQWLVFCCNWDFYRCYSNSVVRFRPVFWKEFFQLVFLIGKLSSQSMWKTTEICQSDSQILL